MHRLTNHGRSVPSHLHPVPSQGFCTVLSPCACSVPSKPPATLWTPTSMSPTCPDGVWPLPGWAGTKGASHAHPKYILGTLRGSGADQGCPRRVAETGMGSTQAALEAPQATGPVKPLRITSLMLMDFSLMPQIKVIGLGWPMDSAQVGRGGSARAVIDPAHPRRACVPWAAPHPARPLSALSLAFWFAQTPKTRPEIHLSLSRSLIQARRLLLERIGGGECQGSAAAFTPSGEHGQRLGRARRSGIRFHKSLLFPAVPQPSHRPQRA